METCYWTACNNTISVDNQTVEHLQAHPEAENLLETAISKIVLPNRCLLDVELVFDRIIGQSSCVAINPSDSAMFAIRIGRDKPTRVAVDAKKVDTKSFVVIAHRTSIGWRLLTAYVGSKAPREPHDRYFAEPRNRAEFLNALAFWNAHGLVWEENMMSSPYESTWKKELLTMGHVGARLVW